MSESVEMMKKRLEFLIRERDHKRAEAEQLVKKWHSTRREGIFGALIGTKDTQTTAQRMEHTKNRVEDLNSEIRKLNFEIKQLESEIKNRSEVTVTSKTPEASSLSKTFCRYCGVENETDAVFCKKCGKKIT
jgi:ribosomal protein L40E